MPGEWIAALVERIDFDRGPDTWLPQFEAVLHRIVGYEFYLDKVPDYLSLPKYRPIVIRVIYRMLQQTPSGVEPFSREMQYPDPRIRMVLEYIRKAELARREALHRRYPVTTKNVRAILKKLKEEREI